MWNSSFRQMEELFYCQCPLHHCSDLWAPDVHWKCLKKPPLAQKWKLDMTWRMKKTSDVSRLRASSSTLFLQWVCKKSGSCKECHPSAFTVNPVSFLNASVSVYMGHESTSPHRPTVCLPTLLPTWQPHCQVSLRLGYRTSQRSSPSMISFPMHCCFIWPRPCR